ncbi:MAG: hypothetical protein QM703_14165 [Gemmatales bacterium]
MKTKQTLKKRNCCLAMPEPPKKDPPEPPDPNYIARLNHAKPPIRSYLSGPSRLVFVAPENARLPLFTPASGDSRQVVDHWLNTVSSWPMRVAKEAAIGPSKPRMPNAYETCLEIPYRLLISPSSSETRWITTSDRMPFAPPASKTTSEIWNAALMSRKKVEPAKPADDLSDLAPDLAPLKEATLLAKALYTPDLHTGDAKDGDYFPGKLPLSLSKMTRQRLVTQMKDEGWIDVDHLILTALGSDAFMAYFNPQSFDTIIKNQIANYEANPSGIQTDPKQNQAVLMIWKHRIVVGRDVYFLEAYFGVLFPFIFPAVKVRVNRRQFAAYKETADDFVRSVRLGRIC